MPNAIKQAITQLEHAHHATQGTTTIAYKHFFSFSLTSVLKRLDYNKANRIYTHTNIIDVIKSTLSFYTGKIHKEIDFSHLHSIQDTKELITQYNESDLSFITRVAHNNGIYFYEDEHTIYFCDAYKQSLPTTIPYNPNPNNTLNEPCIHSFFKQDTIVPNSFSQSSSNAAYPLYAQSLHHHSDSAPILYNQHEYRAQTSFNLQDNAHTPLQLQEKYYTCSKESIIAKSNVYHLALGQRININLNKGLRNEILKDYAIIALEQTLIDTASLANTINPNDNTQDTPFIRSYSNTLTILPSSIAFTPSPKSKPLPPHSTQGIVIGQSTNIQAESNTIYTDEYGRVRVRIHCFANQEEIDNALYATHKEYNQSLDSHITSNPSSSRTHRDSPANASLRDSIANTPSSQTRDITRESHTTKDSHSQTDVTRESHTTHSLHSKEANPQESIAKQSNPPYCYSYSPFLRVSTPIASNHSGFYHTPRVGDEVIISYMDNDIDKPYISGSLYNQVNPSLAHLPKEDHITALSARTINERNNQSNTQGNTTPHNTQVSIEQGSNELIFSNLKNKEVITLKAQKDYTESINNNFSQTIHNNKDSITLGNYTESIHKTHNQNITLTKSVKVGGEYLTNVTLSKDTFVGLSNTLSVGASNSLRVTGDSSERIGGDRRVEIGGNQTQSIAKDSQMIIRGERQEHIEGSFTQNVAKDIDVFVANNHTITTNSSIFLNADENMALESKKHLTMHSDTSDISVATDMAIQAGNSLNFNIGETTITATSDSVIIKAGGVEVVIDSNGLVVKGGEVKSE